MEKLTQPAILLLLAGGRAHGYEIIQRLNHLEFMDGDPDTATVYRTLRRMEQEGLLDSAWEHGELGPARRQYRLTGDGFKSLDQWAWALRNRQRQIEAFINCYEAWKKAGSGSREGGEVSP
jgi:poly-beta-hydroxybutyrate-responsive repressor